MPTYGIGIHEEPLRFLRFDFYVYDEYLRAGQRDVINGRSNKTVLTRNTEWLTKFMFGDDATTTGRPTPDSDKVPVERGVDLTAGVDGDSRLAARLGRGRRRRLAARLGQGAHRARPRCDGGRRRRLAAQLGRGRRRRLTARLGQGARRARPRCVTRRAATTTGRSTRTRAAVERGLAHTWIRSHRSSSTGAKRLPARRHVGDRRRRRLRCPSRWHVITSPPQCRLSEDRHRELFQNGQGAKASGLSPRASCD